MLRSLSSAVSGLENMQTALDVVGNNIANVNTVGFKASSITFQDLFTQMLAGASAPTATHGGTNPMQVGLGVSTAAITPNMSQGSLQTTGNPLNMAIQGNGFFVASQNGVDMYTRAGAFNLDANGNLVNPAGLLVQGWQATASGTFPATTAANMSNIQIQQGESIAPQATTGLALTGNLNSNDSTGTTRTALADAYDSLGNLVPVTVTFDKTAANTWSWDATVPASLVSGATSPVSVGSGSVGFTASGAVTSGTTSGSFIIPPTGSLADGASTISGGFDLSGMTQYAAPTTVTQSTLTQAQLTAGDVTGYAPGTLEQVSVDPSGVITGIFTNGQREELAQVAMANFSNPTGLQDQGNGLYAVSNNSGPAAVGAANTGGRGSIAPGSLEMSNVNLSTEFVNMITAERAFQADSQVVGADNLVLQTLNTLNQVP
ncbi:MAG: flagellar basal-body rod protein FlgF [Thermaerobacter sp.]|jgi:flagellar hook protein FlgE|nr:flagellar basal-body rod protein FlgF [Thermaerobacter sp.]MDA8146728.1 flagellar basal-body rod protein FlgF [Thermaerobacter sp.]